MERETFIKISGLLQMTAKDIARETGYSLATIKAVSAGYRQISPQLESFMLDKLRESADDEAVKLVVETCKEEE